MTLLLRYFFVNDLILIENKEDKYSSDRCYLVKYIESETT